MQLEFTKADHKTTPTGKSGRGLGLENLPNILGSPLIFLQRSPSTLSVSGSSCFTSHQQHSELQTRTLYKRSFTWLFDFRSISVLLPVDSCVYCSSVNYQIISQIINHFSPNLKSNHSLSHIWNSKILEVPLDKNRWHQIVLRKNNLKTSSLAMVERPREA